MSIYKRISTVRIQEIAEYSTQIDNHMKRDFIESMITEREVYQDAEAMTFFTVEAKISHYKIKLEETYSHSLRKVYLNLLIECLMDKIIKDHC